MRSRRHPGISAASLHRIFGVSIDTAIVLHEAKHPAPLNPRPPASENTAEGFDASPNDLSARAPRRSTTLCVRITTLYVPEKSPHALNTKPPHRRKRRRSLRRSLTTTRHSSRWRAANGSKTKCTRYAFPIRPTRWSTTLLLKVILPHAVDFRNAVQMWSRNAPPNGHSETRVLHQPSSRTSPNISDASTDHIS